MNYLFFLLLIPFLLIPSAYAETGKNFDTEPLDHGLTKWTSHPERILDNGQWKNYILTEDASSIKYESAGISFKLDKTDCTFNLYDSGVIGGRTPDIDSFSHNLKLDGIDVIESCTISSISHDLDFFQIVIDNGKFQTVYDLSYTGSLEWTFNFNNKEGKQTTYTIEDLCKDCTPDRIQGDLIQFGGFILDTKNSVHETLINSINDKGNYVMTYEKVLEDKAAFSIDPVFFSTGTSLMARVAVSASAVCSPTGLDILAATIGWFWADTADAVNASCQLGIFEVDITSIPDTTTISNSSFSSSVTTATNSRNSQFTYISSITQPSTRPNNAANALALYNEVYGGTNLTTTTKFQTAGLNEQVGLGSSANSLFTSDLSSGKNWIAVGFIPENRTRSGGGIDRIITLTPATVRFTFTYGGNITSITDLIATDIRGTAVDLDWSTPIVSGGALAGYQLNQTTPWGVPSTIILNTTSLETDYTVSGLTGSTNYSFRVGSISESGVINASGNILNITTDYDPTASFTPGTFDLNATGIDIRTFKFSRNDTATSTILSVTYPNTFNATCNFYYKFAMTNRSYTNLADVAVNAAEDRATFTFSGLNNDIIDVNCYNTPSNVTGRYLITQSHFPFQDQLDNFRNGTYGTYGDFGAFDFITIIAVIASMIGFNRVNELVGVTLSAVMIGALAFFDLIAWQTTLTASFAVLIFWAWSTHHKD